MITVDVIETADNTVSVVNNNYVNKWGIVNDSYI